MLRELSFRHRSWPLKAPFRISRGVRESTEVVEVEIRQHGQAGRGESVPYPRYRETIDSVLEQLHEASAAIEAGLPRAALHEVLPAGAARNALDCALWDLESRLSGQAVHARLRQPPLPSLGSAVTLGIDTPERMAAAARAVASVALIKVKLDANDPAARLRAVRREAPGARLIVDPNESWDVELLRRLGPVLRETGVALVEQPLPAGADAGLAGLDVGCPVCADESCHTVADLPALRERYQAVNIKLDKTGGLSHALELLDAAHAAGFQVMVGCMVSTSLSIVPALHVARHADFVDLDGPWWLREDQPGGILLEDGIIRPPAPGFWGDPLPLPALSS
ncbi:MAG: dipeptide epimerase [Pseudoxanthomonas sp.]